MFRRTFLKPIVTLAFLAAAAPVLLAQSGSVETVEYDQPDASFPEPFSAILGLRELSGGQVLISDRIEQAVRRLDFQRGSMERVGRTGGGPGEYQMPGGLFALPGDTTLLMDMGNQRLVAILPDGQISSKSIPLRHPAGFPIFPRGVDAQGRIYFDLAGMMMPGLEEGAMAGVAPILRWGRSDESLDTLGYVNFPPMEPAGPGEARIEIGGGRFDPRDAWSVAPDGRVGIARREPYHVEWLSATGTAASGPAVPYDPVRVTRADKEAWADAMTSRGVMIQVENGRRRTMRPPRPNVDNLDWPDFKPPFTAYTARVTPEGELWLERSGSAEQRQRTYDVFDGSGNLVRQAVLLPGRELIAFGDGVLYALYTDEDDLQWLERYKR
ncbi:MAG: NHL repeat-containing protein [Planctomycetota bacterium]|jgi:hypothetical protein